MPAIRNPIPNMTEAAEAAGKILSLQAELFLLRQEVATLRQIKKGIWLGISLVLLNMAIFFTFYWLGVNLHEHGWSALTLTVLCFFFFGSLSGGAAAYAFKIGQGPKQPSQKNPGKSHLYENETTLS